MIFRRPMFLLLLCSLPALAQSCDEALWEHVYRPDRLTVQEKCVTVIGTIVDATVDEKKPTKDGVRHEEDGDTHGWLKLDPGQEKFLNAGNRGAEGGNLVFEVICRYSVKQSDAKTACANFKNAIKIPRVGSHVAITGTWVQDSEHEKWFEIHPVSSIVVKK